MGCKQNRGAVAPARHVSIRKSSTYPRLETIVEEGCENESVFTKKIFLYLPVVLSTASKGLRILSSFLEALKSTSKKDEKNSMIMEGEINDE
ncbi:hypothetical protein Gotur_028865 [Gossypium turneri]